MSSNRMLPVLLRVRSPRIEQPSCRPRSVWAGVLAAVLFVVFALFVVAANAPIARTVMLSLLCAGSVFLAASIRGEGSMWYSRLSVAKQGPLRFLMPVRVRVLWGVGAILCLFAALGVVWSSVVAQEDRFGRAGFVLAVACFAAFVMWLLRQFTQPGVRIDSDGLSWPTGAKRHVVPWDALARVVLIPRNKYAVILVLEGVDGRAYPHYGNTHGSNPYLVAEVIEYFRTHPAERAVLNDPLAALALVGEVSAV